MRACTTGSSGNDRGALDSARERAFFAALGLDRRSRVGHAACGEVPFVVTHEGLVH
jgi:hypothetical protein